jgi:putative peptidoglycan lipid II flippase
VNLLRAASTISLLTLASRVTGLVRDQLIAAQFGAGALTDAFNVAFRLPNLLRRLFAEGAFSQAFVPFLAATRERDGDDATQSLIDAVATVLLWAAADLCGGCGGRAGAGLAAGCRAAGIRPGGADGALDVPLHRLHVAGGAGGRHPEHLAALCRAGAHARALEPEPDRCGLAGCAAVQGLGPAAHPGPGRRCDAGRAAAAGVQAPALARIGRLPRFGLAPAAVKRAWQHPGVRQILRQMAPALLGVSVAQVSLLINTQIASQLGVGAPCRGCSMPTA